MLNMLLLVIFFIGSLISLSVAADLQQLQVVFRHGSRFPSLSFPTDPHIHKYDFSKKELTVVGARQAFQLGTYLRLHYNGLIPAVYDPRHVYARSTNTDRTIASMESVLAGLYFESDSAMHISAQLPWFPLPVHTKDIKADVFSVDEFSCPKRDVLHKDFLSNPDGFFKRDERDYANYISDLGGYTGMRDMDLEKTHELASIMQCWRAVNFTFPQWMTKDVEQTLLELRNRKYKYLFSDAGVQKLAGGPPLSVLLGEMESRQSGSQLQLVMYASHDTTISAILSLLEVHNGLAPPFSAALLFEFYTDSSIRIVYRNSSTDGPYELHIPSCPSPCYLHTLSTIYESALTLDNCSLPSFFYHYVAVVVLCILLAVICLLCKKRRFLCLVPCCCRQMFRARVYEDSSRNLYATKQLSSVHTA